MSIAAAIRAAGRAAAQAGGTQITIRRGSQEICVPALRGSSQFESVVTDTGEPVVVHVRSQDFLIAREDYDFGDCPVEPARGDQVLVTDGQTTDTYELLNLPGQPAWRWSDEYQQRLRLHTKAVAPA